MFVKQYLPRDWHIKWCKDVVSVPMTLADCCFSVLLLKQVMLKHTPPSSSPQPNPVILCQLTGLLLMQTWILCAGLTSSGKGVLQCSPILPYLLCLEHIFQDGVEFEAEVVELHHVNNQLSSMMYACSHDKISCQALHLPYACMQAAQSESDVPAHGIR